MSETFILLLGVIFFLSLYLWGVRDLEKWDKRAQYAQALLTLLALLTTGYWFFLERKGMPHADVSQEVSVIPLTSELVAIESHVRIKNLGERLLEIDKINSRLQLVRPDAYDYVALNRKNGEDYWLAERPNASKSSEQFHIAELRWPIYRQYRDDVQHSIEPGETDLLVVTFLMECRLAKWARVATDVYKPEPRSFGKIEEADAQGESEGEEDVNFAWKARSFVDVAEICAKGEKTNER